MAKKEYAEGRFGAYLVKLLKEHEKSQADFIVELGISKTYLVDVLNGRLKPPAPEMQERIIEVLRLDSQERCEFYDKVAEGRQELPKDITDYLLDNKMEIKRLRERIGIYHGQ